MVIDTEAHPSAILHRIGLPKPVGIGVGADFTELRIPLRPHHARCIRLVQAALTLGRGHGWIDVPRSQPRCSAFATSTRLRDSSKGLNDSSRGSSRKNKAGEPPAALPASSERWQRADGHSTCYHSVRSRLEDRLIDHKTACSGLNPSTWRKRSTAPHRRLSERSPTLLSSAIEEAWPPRYSRPRPWPGVSNTLTNFRTFAASEQFALICINQHQRRLINSKDCRLR